MCEQKIGQHPAKLCTSSLKVTEHKTPSSIIHFSSLKQVPEKGQTNQSLLFYTSPGEGRRRAKFRSPLRERLSALPHSSLNTALLLSVQ